MPTLRRADWASAFETLEFDETMKDNVRLLRSTTSNIDEAENSGKVVGFKESWRFRSAFSCRNQVFELLLN